jgi:hypothetical protein
MPFARGMQQTASPVDPGPEVARRVRASSVAAVARQLGMAREQIARLAGGLDVREATRALARERLRERGGV